MSLTMRIDTCMCACLYCTGKFARIAKDFTCQCLLDIVEVGALSCSSLEEEGMASHSVCIAFDFGPLETLWIGAATEAKTWNWPEADCMCPIAREPNRGRIRPVSKLTPIKAESGTESFLQVPFKQGCSWICVFWFHSFK